jgi:ferrochelatase
MYDALVVLSFGGPEGPDDVMPFLENVTRGRSVPRERLLEVKAHYDLFGGVSPANASTRALVLALANAVDMPVYWGNRNWHPLLTDTVRQMRADGVQRAVCFVTSAYAGYSSCRQYLSDIAGAVGDDGPVIDKLRPFYDHPGFIEPMVANVNSVMPHPAARLLFSAHSIPLAVSATNQYAAQVEEASRLVASMVPGEHPWEVCWQSRSGPPSQPWLEPDIGDRVAGVSEPAAVIVPIGFVADHMEVVYDLDVVAASRASVPTVRAPTVGSAPAFIEMVRLLIAERTDPSAPRLGLGRLGPKALDCAADCCPGQTSPRGP